MHDNSDWHSIEAFESFQCDDIFRQFGRQRRRIFEKSRFGGIAAIVFVMAEFMKHATHIEIRNFEQRFITAIFRWIEIKFCSDFLRRYW